MTEERKGRDSLLKWGVSPLPRSERVDTRQDVGAPSRPTPTQPPAGGSAVPPSPSGPPASNRSNSNGDAG